MWRSLVSAPALGAGGRGFESRHPDQVTAMLIFAYSRVGAKVGASSVTLLPWLTPGAGTAMTPSTSTIA